MTGPIEYSVHHDVADVAEATATRLISRIAEVQEAKGHAHVALTGGGTGIAVLAHAGTSPAWDAVDLGRLSVWWGDERYLPDGDPDRNETQARQALPALRAVPETQYHPMPPAGAHRTPEDAADAYATDLVTAGRGSVLDLDIVLLGLGEDAHVASLFPEHPALHDTRPVVAVHGSPKPPPIRLSLTIPTLNRAREVWIVAAGTGKADAVRLAVSGAGPLQVPAAGVRGRDRTLLLLDTAAASALPPGLARIASP